ncbi:uncharacterized protein VTP21DRAFT_6952 [Calcarisporiella thermophila]|uniref:uncharacterized protein n=1 Tax=Calcarisporiella thermophila TaxID=911321 RepID=UPI0037428AB0
MTSAHTEHKHVNRLIHEKSPYLLQHAHNPVDWYPWGEEAFERARREDKLIFLSVGYSTCHWCHVMEKESFENESVAKIMNENYVNIKVDREVQPDVDRLYMTFVQIFSGGGGWPMSVFLTPELYPIYGATYFPPEDLPGRRGFKTVLGAVAKLWEEQKEELRSSAKGNINQLQQFLAATPAQKESDDALVSWKLADATFANFRERFDKEHGGFGSEPKFPTPVQLRFLVDYWYYCQKSRTDEVSGEGSKGGVKEKGREALNMAVVTLKKIAAGGIHDHVGSGFHRYSTDRYWHVPHFEKMLYDQGQLLQSYLSAYLITKDASLADVAKDIVRYVSRDLAHPEGGFYSAEDADSYPRHGDKEKKEGAFCVWEASEISQICGEPNAAIFSYHYGVKPDGNVDPAKDIQGELVKKNVLIERHSLEETAKEFGKGVEEVKDILANCREQLLRVRMEERPKSHLDDKVLTAWNGLMIGPLAQASHILKQPEYLNLALKAARFIKNHLYRSDSNTLLRSYREGPSNTVGFADDYAYLISSLLDLYEATFDDAWIEWASNLQQKMDEEFWDEEGNGGYFGALKDEKILLRLKEGHDGAEPSISAIAATNLMRLGHILEDPSLLERARKTIRAFGDELKRHPSGMPSLVRAGMMELASVREVVVCGGEADEKVAELLEVVRNTFMPNAVIVRTTANSESYLAQKNQTIRGFVGNQNASVHVCENFTCGLPVDNAEDLAAKL